MHNPFPSFYEEFIYKSRYARFIDSEKRRENWDETVNRYINYFREKYPSVLDKKTCQTLFNAIYNLQCMPSMRALATAGPALDRDNTAGFNCSYLPVDNPHSFDEAMYILMCGTGVGFSVQKRYTNQLPEVPDRLFDSQTTIMVHDSKEGWAKAYRQLIALLYSGEIPKWDVSRVRAAGKRLKTFGGRASGPKPLVDLFEFTVRTFKHAAGRKLQPVECHDIMCKIGDIVVVGGVRRSALISLSDLEDEAMRHAKSWYKVTQFLYLSKATDDKGKTKYTYSLTYVDSLGVERCGHFELDEFALPDLHDNKRVYWSVVSPHRALANNSIAYEEKPSVSAFLKEWESLYSSYSGERGIFNLQASQNQAAKNGRRDTNHIFGTNPCSEIILRPYQFCNLSEVVVRAEDTVKTLKEKVKVATILGTLQSSLTNFPYLRKVWENNTKEECLLGVSLTGIYDNPSLFTPSVLEVLKEEAVRTNKKWAKKLGINPSTAITCVKPSGTVSQLVDAASGIHPRYGRFYIRRVRADNKDPLTTFLKESGIPNEPCIFKKETTTVFSFPMKAPITATTRHQIKAIEHLEFWKMFQDHWCEHKPSATIYVEENEWVDVAAWTYKHFDNISGVSYLPYDGGSYQQAPYEEVEEEKYLELVQKMPSCVDWSKLIHFEREDNTGSSQTMACSGGACEIVDLV